MLTLPEILALRPTSGDSATIRAAILRAKTAQAEALAEAANLDRQAAAGLLTATDEEVLDLERQASVARLTADRISRLLPEIEAQLPGSEKAEALQAIRDAAAEYSGNVEAFEAAWNEKYLPAASVIVDLMQMAADLEKEFEAVRVKISTATAARLDWEPGETPAALTPKARHKLMFMYLSTEQRFTYPPDFVQLPGVTTKQRTLWTHGGPGKQLVDLQNRVSRHWG